jgi:hypothetical protein
VTIRSVCVLLFKKPFWAGLESGTITLTFRRWHKPKVRPGGRYRCHPIGVLEVDAITRVTVADLTDDDARRAGFASRDLLIAYLAELGPLAPTTELFRVELHHGGDGDRVEQALEASLTDDDVAALRARLARLDRDGPWTAATLAIIEARPRVAASQLAASLGRETLPFKVDVRKLKKLGLTQSFEVGYEVSPRGRAYLAAVRALGDAPAMSARASRATATRKSKNRPTNKPKTKSKNKPANKPANKRASKSRTSKAASSTQRALVARIDKQTIEPRRAPRAGSDAAPTMKKGWPSSHRPRTSPGRKQRGRAASARSAR